MSGEKFTKGPWLRDGLLVYALHHYGDYQNGKPFLVNRFSAQVHSWVSQGGSEAEAEATAHLIAAAPEMYEALATVARLAEHTPIGDSVRAAATFRSLYPMVIAALAKARGEQ